MIWIVLSRNMLVFFTIDDWEIIYPCFFLFNFLDNILVFFLSMLKAFVIERKIVLAVDACFRPPIIIRSHDLHVGDIKRAMGEITSYHERD
jgi:hypothetical protein